jgi:hypothetical protein
MELLAVLGSSSEGFVDVNTAPVTPKPRAAAVGLSRLGDDVGAVSEHASAVATASVATARRELGIRI